MTNWDTESFMEVAKRPPLTGFMEKIGGPAEFSGWFNEGLSWHKTAELGNWNGLLKLRIKGPEALKLLSNLSVNSFSKFAIGQAKHCIQCNTDGKVICHGILLRHAEDEFEYQGGPLIFWTAYQCQAGQYNAIVKPVPTFSWQVSGPNALYVVEKASGERLRDIQYMHFRDITIHGVMMRALRQSMAAEIGFELQGPLEHVDEVAACLMEAGQEFGIEKVGNRMSVVQETEAGFAQTMSSFLPAICGDTPEDIAFRKALETVAPGLFEMMMKIDGSFEVADVRDLYRSPIEMGETKMIKFDHEFIGRRALEAEVTNPKRVFVTLVWDSEDLIDIYASLFRKGEMYRYVELPRLNVAYCTTDKVLNADGQLIGLAANHGYSPGLRQYLTTCTIDVRYSSPGTHVIVVWGGPGQLQKKVRAVVAPAPYKKDNRRMDLTTLPVYLNK